MTHPSDYRWGLTAPAHRPTIAVIERPTFVEDWEKREQGHQGTPVMRAPFGFARVLLGDLCGYPARRRHLGGCELPFGHEGGHRYRPHDPVPVRPHRTYRQGG